MPACRLQRYILREIAVPTGLALFIFTFILFLGRILKLAEMVLNKGVPLSDIATLFAYLLPAFLVITLPLSFLLGVLLGFGRLSADSEIVALQSSGISLYEMLTPVLGLAAVTSLITAVLTLVVEPYSNSAFRRQLFRIATSQAFVGLQPQTFNNDFKGLVIYANGVDERTGLMSGIFIADERAGSIPSIIVAENGRILADPNMLSLNLRLDSGSIHRQSRKSEDYQVVGFATYDVSLNLGQQTAEENRPRKANEIATGELWRRSPGTGEEDRKLTAELQQRFIFPLTPLLFALIALPLGIRTQRSGRGGGFAIGLFVFLAYYILQSFSETLAIEGKWPPVTLWIPTSLFLAGGLFVLVETARERRIWASGGILSSLTRAFRR